MRADRAMEDWTLPGLIDDEAARAFGETALRTDPRSAPLRRRPGYQGGAAVDSSREKMNYGLEII